MKLLNLGCGAVRVVDEHWTNLDCLRDSLPLGTPERVNLDNEPNYVDFRIGSGPLPFESETFDGVLLSHVIEHLDCHEAVSLLTECRRILKDGASVMVSVPDASYFRKVHALDTPENAPELFGEPICPDEPWHKSFFDYALFYDQHKQVLTEDSLWCLFVRAGFSSAFICPHWSYEAQRNINAGLYEAVRRIINRLKFSLVMVGIKNESK